MKKQKTDSGNFEMSPEELKNSLEMYRQMVDNLREVLWVVATNWQKVFYISPAYEQVWGRSCESLYANPMSWLDSVVKEDRDKLIAGIRKRSEGDVDDPSFPEYRIRQPDGTVRWISARAYPIRNSSGDIDRIAGIAEDVTEQKTAGETLERERNLIDQLMETTPVGVTVVNKDGQITFANECAQRILGLEKKKITQLTFNAPEWKITDLEGKPLDEEQLPFMRVKRELKSVYDVRHAIRWPDGRVVKLSINSAPLLAQHNTFGGMVSCLEDITERIASEDALRESEERFRNIVQSSPMGIHMYRLEPGNRLIFTGANPAADRILEVDHSALAGMTIEEAFPLLKDTEIIEAYRKVCSDGTPYYNEQIRYKDGKISGAFEVHAFRTAPDTLAVMFLEITGRLKADELIRESLATKETLLKEIHHRVKNNLQVISGLLDLQTHHVEEEKYRKIFKESQSRVLTMALIHQELYRAEDLASINFGEFIRNLIQTLIGSYTVNQDVINFQYNVEELSIVIDTAIPCGLIINELVTNSLKHAFPDGNRGTIRVTFRSIGEKLYELVVCDDGVGLPEDVDFSRTRSLGLQLVFTLGEQLNSKIIVSREKGTCFTFRFSEYSEAGTVLH